MAVLQRNISCMVFSRLSDLRWNRYASVLISSAFCLEGSLCFICIAHLVARKVCLYFECIFFYFTHINKIIVNEVKPAPPYCVETENPRAAIVLLMLCLLCWHSLKLGYVSLCWLNFTHLSGIWNCCSTPLEGIIVEPLKRLNVSQFCVLTAWWEHFC